MDKVPVIKVLWDAEAKVWVAESDDIPGLATEAPTMENLIQKLKVIVPELLSLNKSFPIVDNKEIPIEILSRREEKIRLSTSS